MACETLDLFQRQQVMNMAQSIALALSEESEFKKYQEETDRKWRKLSE